MIVTAWNNGRHHATGAGYALKIDPVDRDRYFQREWGSIIIELDGEDDTAEINIDKPSFWNATCRELIHIEIGRWLIQTGLAPWPKGKSPKLILEPSSESGYFYLSRV